MNRDGLILWLAQGFGVGRVPFAPGTFGALLGLAWLACLLAPGNLWLFLAGMATACGLSVWLSGRAERILGQTDPGSVVVDEIVAIPLSFSGWVVAHFLRAGQMPAPHELWSAQAWYWTLGLWAAFRFFDILKPWPIHASQRLPGGWGVTADDLLAAVYVNALAGLVCLARNFLG